MAKTNFSAELEWSDIEFKTKSSRKDPSKTILSNISGIVRPGELLAIMGPSGSGKTTLLNCLSGRFQKNLTKVSGQVLINGRKIESVNYKAMIGFVPQDDVLLEFLTPRETLTFSAAFTTNLAPEERKAAVDRMIEELGLSSCADSTIGGHIVRGISGGEKKRTSIGVELIFNPSVLFLDEPTTGLDSFNADQIIHLLVTLTKKDSTLIATIHQPSSQMVSRFDKLMLLAHGNSVYTGRSKGAVPFFEDLGYPLAKNYNPGDYFMNILSGEQFSRKDYRESVISKLMRVSSSVNTTLDIPVSHYQVGTYAAFKLLFSRAVMEFARNPIALKGKVLKVAILSALTCMVFANLGTDLSNLGDRYGAVFMLCNSVVMEGVTSTISTFHMQKAVFLREYAGRRYSVEAFFLSYTCAILPIEMFYQIGYFSCCYYVMKLNPLIPSFLLMLVVGALTSLAGSGFGLIISSGAPSLEVASMLAPLAFLPMLVCGGLLVSYDRDPSWFFIQYLSPFRYAFEAAVRIDMDDNPDLSENVRKFGVDSLGMPENLQNAIGILAAIAISARIMALLMMKYINRNN